MTDPNDMPPPVDQSQPLEPLPPRSVTVLQRRGPNTAGCIAILFGALLIGGGLAAVGLFLPPFNLAASLFGPQFVMLDASTNAAAVDGLTIQVDPEDPGRSFGVALTRVEADTFLTGSVTQAEWMGRVRAAVPGFLTLASPVFDIDTTGEAPDTVSIVLDLPANAALDTLDAYGFDSQSGQWRFLPSQPTVGGGLLVETRVLPRRVALFHTGPVDPAVVVPIEISQDLTDEAAQLATVVTPAGLTPNAAGQLVGSLAPGWVHNAPYRVMPLIRNYDDPRAVDVATVQALIASPGSRRAHVQQLVGAAIGSSFDGVFIDYRGLPESSADDFSIFVAELKQAFSSNGLLLGVVVPQPENADGIWRTGAYEWRRIGATADFVQIEFALDPLTFAPGPDRYVEAALRWATREVSRYKLLGGLNALSLREFNGTLTPVTYTEALARLGRVESPNRRVEPGDVIRARLDGLAAHPGVEALVQAPFIIFQNEDGTNAEKVWLTTGEALRFRLERLLPFMLGGVALTDLSTDGLAAGVAKTVLDYKLALPVEPSPAELALRWRVQDSQRVLAEVVTGLNEDLTVTLEAVEGNVAINVEVVGGQQAVPLSGVQVAVLRPTSTPTPLPTSLATLVPTMTPPLETIIATQTPIAGFNRPFVGSGLPAVNPGPGSIQIGAFEYGGQVTGVDSQTAIAAMRQAGMTWMKIQVVYRPGNDPSGIGGLIQTAKGNGFKILISALGVPEDLAAGSGGYIQGFAGYLAGVASYGPDAIEVWNEPNISREWPVGQISGANYAAMLGNAYAAIKGASPGTMVISAAPAPTGGEAAFPPGHVRNDDAWLNEFVQAGGINYADCIGVHYNEGIVPPNVTSGDPRDDFYTRYFGSMVNVYWELTKKPLCFTELGYLTPEGFGAALAENFLWGSQTTVAQQAAWLAQAIAMASQSGKVRLLIVWNVDFTRYDGNDPQGGYAIIRPGGGCPACAAIAAAR
jgi:hypothetical protein